MSSRFHGCKRINHQRGRHPRRKKLNIHCKEKKTFIDHLQCNGQWKRETTDLQLHEWGFNLICKTEKKGKKKQCQSVTWTKSRPLRLPSFTHIKEISVNFKQRQGSLRHLWIHNIDQVNMNALLMQHWIYIFIYIYKLCIKVLSRYDTM